MIEEPYGSNYYEDLRPAAGLPAAVDALRDRLVVGLVQSLATPGRLLDIGCGRGDLLGRFDERTWQRHGVELSEEGLRLTRDRLPGATLAAADIQDGLPFDPPFDAITMVNVLEHLEHPAEALAHIASAQDPGGVLIVHLPTIGTPGQAHRYEQSYASDPTHVYRPSGATVVDLVQGHGYRTIRAAWAPFRPFWLWSRIEWQCAFLAVFVRR